MFGAGDNATVINDVFANPRNPATFSTTAAIDRCHRAGCRHPGGMAVEPRRLLAGAVEVYPTDAWGTSYEIPMGVDSGLGQNFEYTAASIMAAPSATTVDVDVDADGGVDQTVVLAAGESVLVPGLSEGATITANGPIQVDMLTGDVGATV